MQVDTLPCGAALLTPAPAHDHRGFFTRTFDAAVFDSWCERTSLALRSADFIQDSQSRSWRGVVRGLHGRSGAGEAKLVRCANGTILDIIVDIRLRSPTFLEVTQVRLDDVTCAALYVPRGFLHGFQALSDTADVCYRIDRAHDPRENLSVRFDDPALGIGWPLPITNLSKADARAGSLQQLLGRLGFR